MVASNETLSREQVRELIRKAGLRATPGRIASYQVLRAATAPLTHGDVVQRLDGDGFDRATVYRNLIDLSDAGLVARSDHGDHAWRFELSHKSDGSHEHIHFVCVDCGDVSCLPAVDVRITASRTGAGSVPKAVSDKQVDVQLRGRCDGCS
jgi:Fur family ferric uptake transcriptional regulator